MIKSNAWVDKYAPKTIKECFLPNATREHLEQILSSGDIPSMFFSGPPGIGKTTVALAICEELDLEYLFINASLHGNIDTIRTDIQSFASSIAMNGKKKIIILDEADWLTAAAQASLRGVINEFTDNVAFILTSNYRNKIIEPIISRLVEVNFLFPRNELPVLAKGLFDFIICRLDEEQVSYNVKAVQKFILDNLSNSTDIRKILINAQKISMSGVFDLNSLINIDKGRLDEMVDIVKGRNYKNIRDWVGENSDLEFDIIAKHLYHNIYSIVGDSKVPVLISIINQHQFQHAFVVDKEINLASMLAEVSMAL